MANPREEDEEEQEDAQPVVATQAELDEKYGWNR